MSTAIRSLQVAGRQSVFYLRELRRYYGRRPPQHDDINISSTDRIPSRLKKRLEKQGLSVEDFTGGSQPQTQKDLPTPTEGSYVTPPGFASSGFPKGSEELNTLIKATKEKADIPGVQPSPEFPSDFEKNPDWQRLQSRKAFRPRVDPSETSIILFPGQGSQFVGMGKDTLGYGNASDLFEEANAFLGYDLLNMCLSGPFSALSKTIHCQPAVLVSSLAAIEKLKEQNPEAIEKCVGTAGFSVGELTALVFAQALTFEDALEIVRVRAEAMQRASEEVASGMMTVFLNHSSNLKTAMLGAREYCKQRCDIQDPVCQVANYLYPECKVIAGHQEALDFIAKHAKTFGIRRTKRLPVSGAFHTKLMLPAKEEVKKVLERVHVQAPEIPVYSNVTASRFRHQSRMVGLMTDQVVAPVKWEQTLHVMYSRPQGEEFPHTYEAGPGNQLGALLKMVNSKAHAKYAQVKV